MANRFVLNETSYHGKGAIQEIATEIQARGFKKAFVCSDPDLIKFEVTKKVTDNLTEALPAYIAIIAMPLFYSISEGISLGIISYVLLNVAAGKGKTVKPLMYVLAVLFVLKYIFL